MFSVPISQKPLQSGIILKKYHPSRTASARAGTLATAYYRRPARRRATCAHRPGIRNSKLIKLKRNPPNGSDAHAHSRSEDPRNRRQTSDAAMPPKKADPPRGSNASLRPPGPVRTYAYVDPLFPAILSRIAKEPPKQRGSHSLFRAASQTEAPEQPGLRSAFRAASRSRSPKEAPEQLQRGLHNAPAFGAAPPKEATGHRGVQNAFGAASPKEAPGGQRGLHNTFGAASQ